MSHFQFEKLEVWKAAMNLSADILSIAKSESLKSKYRYLDQLYGATMSITNNIAEGSGSSSKKDFARYLSIARSSVFEVANILILFEKEELISREQRMLHYQKLTELSKSLFFLRKHLLSKT